MSEKCYIFLLGPCQRGHLELDPNLRGLVCVCARLCVLARAHAWGQAHVGAYRSRNSVGSEFVGYALELEANWVISVTRNKVNQGRRRG